MSKLMRRSIKMNKRLRILRLSAVVILLMISDASFAQLDNIHYCPPIHSRQNGQIAEQYVYLSTPEAVPFTVTLVDGADNFIASAIISNGSPADIYIGSGQFPGTDVAVPKDSCGAVIKASGFIATAPNDFYCNVRIKAPYQATSIACKGQAALGYEFYAGSMPQVVNNSNRNFCTSIMATEDGTVVNVSDYNTSVVFETSGGGIGADALTFFMNAGDCMVLTGYTTTNPANMAGFIGAHITSNELIAVNTGNYMGSIHSEGYQDGGMVQIVPVNLLGTEHVVVEGQGGDVMERPMVVAVADGTDIFINDIGPAVATIDEGEYYLIPSSYYDDGLHNNMSIITNIPAYVYQCTAANTSSATSEFNYIPPLECYLTSEINEIPNINEIGGTTFEGILYIVTASGATVLVNGAPLDPGTGPKPAEGLPGWETYKLLDVSGNIAISSTAAMSAGFVSVNGYAAAGAFYAGFTFEFVIDGGPDLEVCNGEEVLLYGTGAGVDGVYTWDGGLIDSVAFIPGATMTYNLAGTRLDGCENYDSVKVTVHEFSESDAGPDQELCDTNATTFDGNALLEFGAGEWTMASGPSPVTYADSSDAATEVYDLVEGTYEFVWEVTNGTCPPETDTMMVTVYDIPNSNAGSDQDLCNEYDTGLNGNIAVGTAAGMWSMEYGPSVPTFSDPSNPITPISDLVEGTYSLIWTISNGTCPDDTDTLVINVYDEPTSSADIDQYLCAEYTAALSGNAPVGTASGMWSFESGPGVPTFDDPTGPLTNVNDLEEGTYFLIWTVSNGTCPPAEDTMTINVYDMPVSMAGIDQQLCDMDATTLIGNIPDGSATGEWSHLSGPTTAVFDDITDPGTIASGLVIGTYNLIWTVSNGICDPVTDTVTVIVYPYPTIAFTASQVAGCEPLGVAFTNLSSPLGDDCLWEFGDGSIEYGCGDVYHDYPNGTFDVTLTVTANGCSTTETIVDYITSIPYPEANMGVFPEVINITNTTVSFSNYSEDAISYTWSFGDSSPNSNEFEPSHDYPEVIDGLYEVMLIAENEFGCADTAYGQVAFEDLLIFYIPNAFTPDASGMNDMFSPVFTSRVDPYDFNMKIFNRWGELMFETFDMNVGWDGSYAGEMVQDGVYVWSISFGDTISDDRHYYKGHITLLR
ncbi:MAG: T9SS type B sorting domain-containing protein [Crocinitomix sp.]|nr:T9SS type B sorting domain-containing protein [Crocinitomix sp.]